MKAEILVYGGDIMPSNSVTIKHWQLWVDGYFLGDTAIPETGSLYQKIVDKINGTEDPEGDDVTA